MKRIIIVIMVVFMFNIFLYCQVKGEVTVTNNDGTTQSFSNDQDGLSQAWDAYQNQVQANNSSTDYGAAGSYYVRDQVDNAGNLSKEIIFDSNFKNTEQFQDDPSRYTEYSYDNMRADGSQDLFKTTYTTEDIYSTQRAGTIQNDPSRIPEMSQQSWDNLPLTDRAQITAASVGQTVTDAWDKVKSVYEDITSVEETK